MTRTLRDKILKEQGIVRTQKRKHKHHKLRTVLPADDGKKTDRMRLLELKYGVVMEEVLVSGSLSMVAEKLGNEIDTSTVSKWIKKLGLRKENNETTT